MFRIGLLFTCDPFIYFEKMALNVWLRLFFYGIHGFFDEIVFTSTVDFIASGFTDWTMKGHSSLWSFFIYGLCSYTVECMYLYLKTNTNIPMAIRGVLYVLWVYTWEFCCGLVLRKFNACPWDYSHMSWNLCGLITLQYFPFWYLASLYQEILTDYLMSIKTGDILCSSCNELVVSEKNKSA